MSLKRLSKLKRLRARTTQAALAARRHRRSEARGRLQTMVPAAYGSS
jgi:hypothetical protein